MVQQYAPGAPASLKNEAVRRFAGYLNQAGFGAMLEESIGELSVTPAPNHGLMFRNCGAAALLTRWRVRRAGAIG